VEGRHRPLLRHKRTVPVYVVFFYQPLYIGRSIRRYYPRDYYRRGGGGGRGARARARERRPKRFLSAWARTREELTEMRLAEHAEHAESRGQGSRRKSRGRWPSRGSLSLSLSLSLCRRDKLGDTALIAGGDSVRSIGHAYGSGGRSMGPVEVQDCSG